MLTSLVSTVVLQCELCDLDGVEVWCRVPLYRHGHSLCSIYTTHSLSDLDIVGGEVPIWTERIVDSCLVRGTNLRVGCVVLEAVLTTPDIVSIK